MKIGEFFVREYMQYAMYNSYRKIGCYIDGLKPSARKVVYTMRKDNAVGPSKRDRVSNIAPHVAKSTEYMHGEVSLYGVIVGMAVSYPGTNNIPLLYPDGNFGKRFINDYSAPRYIYSYANERFNGLFDKRDDAVLIHQMFEGKVIEPKYYVPTLPLILVNGSEGIGTGHAQIILPRSEKVIKQYITTKLAGKIPRVKLTPHYNGFNGTITQDETNHCKYLIRGVFKRVNTTKLSITELPIGYELEQYLTVLDKLVEDKVIKSYKDLSDNGIFKFDISVTRGFTTTNTDDQIIGHLKLQKSVTENYTCIDENNSVRVFESPTEIIDEYMVHRIKCYQQRKDNLIIDITRDLDIAQNRIKFVKDIIANKVNVIKVTKANIVQQLTTLKYAKVDDSYSYLIGMPIYSLTSDTIKELTAKVTEIKTSLKAVKSASTNDMWLADL
jgi:DNA topoisomerase-2